ncbi:Protein gir2 [Polyrhizophydium stewartii]|uniref:Protein gir2 n=1 Tax=Polyrhizophydium stewartii TaxID=2732419 RepID=A0ABR4NAJ8_9FUNG|nr:hypothetical protein HK105_001349 [Polyrhizophydium stewartii]
MTDHAEEQRTELETLGYIFPDELEIIDEGPPAVLRISAALDNEDLLLSLRMHAQAQGLSVDDDEDGGDDDDGDDEAQEGDDAGDDDDGADDDEPTRFEKPALTFEFKYTETYPETLPELRLVKVSGIRKADRRALVDSMLEHGTENLGMAMVFAMVSHGKEKLEELLTARMAREEHEREQRVLAEEEADRERYRGTRVTAESFAAWLHAFVDEAKAVRRSGGKLTVAQEAALAVDAATSGAVAARVASGKLTGRQLFEKDKTLASSDMQFMDEGDVAVDVELFDGLEIDDEDEDEDEDEEVNQVLAGLTEDD